MVSDLIEDESVLKKAKYPDQKANDVFQYFSHLTGINYHKIQNFNPLESKNPIKELEELEEEYVELSEENYITPSGDEKVLVDFGDMAWFDLGKGACDEEADAMGHCGNQPSEREGDRIFSLRKVINVNGETFHKPHLTFIFNSGFLGEMKGRANEKPARRYHKYIVELLKLPIIKGVAGGGYAPEHNFEVDDLDEKYIEELRKLKGDEFVDNAGNPLLPIQILQKQFNEGDKSVVYELVERANLYIEGVIEGSGYYDVSYDKSNDKFYIDAPDFNTWEINKINEGYLDIDPTGLDNYEEFIDSNFTGNFKASIERYIYNTYQEDIQDYFGIDEDEYDFDFVDDNLNEIISNIADSIQMSLNRLYGDAVESGIMSEIISAVNSAKADFLSDLFLEDMTVFEFIDADKFYIKDNNVYGYVENLDTPEVESNLEDMFRVDEPYNGYSGFDDSILEDDEVVEEAFRSNDVELDYFQKEEE
jgi:hypothetical protein